MADEYITAIKARLPCETETSDVDIPVIDLPFWPEIDRLWHDCGDTRDAINDYNNRASGVQPTMHLSLDQLLRKLSRRTLLVLAASITTHGFYP